MINFYEIVGSVQPCDGRTLLQKLVYEIVMEVSKKRETLCNNLSETFTEFGLENFSPCSLVNNTTLDQLLEGDTEGVINFLLVQASLPPHTFKILKSGYDSLIEEEKVDIDKYLEQKSKNYIRNQVEPAIRKEIKEIIKCPDEQKSRILLTRIENTVQTVNRLQAKLNWLEKHVNPIATTVSALDAAFKATEKVIIGLDISIIAQALLPSGAAGLTARTVAKLERFIDNNKDDVSKLDDTLCNAAKAVQFAKTQLSIIQTLLQIVDVLLQNCLIEQEETIGNRLTPITFNRPTRQLEYRGYVLEIRTDPSSPSFAPRRFAVALDQVGVVVLQGTPSFSSSTDILIEELKFRIDNHLG